MRVLTVDDSRAIRNIVSKQIQEMGLEVDEAENGEEGLSRLEEVTYDLVILDVTMPVLDGPGMLRKMREAGNKTPVLMLTSESKSAIIGECLKLGIDDYILKPFKADELRKKIRTVLKLAPAVTAAAAPEPAMVRPTADEVTPGGPPDAAKQFVDILVIDDMENVQKKLRSLIPNSVSLNGALNAQSALAMARERVFRVIFIDLDIPDVDSNNLLAQIRFLQPHASFLALTLKTLNDVVVECRRHGFEDVLYKPFDKNKIDDLLTRFFDDQEILVVEENALTPGPYTGRDDRVDRYFDRVEARVPAALQKMAAACFEDVLVNLANVPLRPDRIPKLISRVSAVASPLGMGVRLAGTPEIGKILSSFAETADFRFYSSLEDARKAS